MASNSTEQKLAKIFSEQFQIKRLMKQISDLKQLREKGSYDIKMSVLKNQCLVFKIQLLAPAYKNTKLPEVLTKLPFDFKIVVRNNYPANPPRLYFMNDNMTKYGFKPFRDYIPEVLGKIQEWSAKITIQQIIKSIPSFLQKIFVDNSIIRKQKFPIFQDYFQIDNIYSWRFCQLYPIKLVRKQVAKQGFMYVDITTPEILIFEDIGMENTISLADYIRGSEIISLRKKKNTSNQFLLQVKLNYNAMQGKYGIEFLSQDHEALLVGIMDCAKVIQNGRKISEGDSKKDQSSSEQQQQQIDQEKPTKKKNNAEVPGNIQELIEQILIYQSLVDNKMTSDNLSQLVTLLQKAIQYYSAKSDETFTIYLNKLQTILSNEMAQALLESSNEQKKRKNNTKGTEIKKDEYKSIVDLL